MSLYTPSPNRYAEHDYRRCGQSGILLPPISLGLWHNFAANDDYENARNLIQCAFDHGITHFDLANNYGIPAGSAETTFGRILRQDFQHHRDELLIATKASHQMWEGPYGDWGSRKHLLASLDQSLLRMGLDYVDIFYAHRYDPITPLEETMGALITAVKSGRALYAGISKYPAHAVREATRLLRDAGVPCLVHQVRYNMLDDVVEEEILPLNAQSGLGCIAFSPLAQGMLTNRYAEGIPADSRAGGKSVFLNVNRVEEHATRVHKLAQIATARGQTLAQMAIAWCVRSPLVTSALIGASKEQQIIDCLTALRNTVFYDDELAAISEV